MPGKINLGKYYQVLAKQVKAGINEGLDILEPDIEKNSPVDTGDYIESNQRTNAIQIGDQIKGSVYNDDPKASNVEYGFRSTEVTWSKKGGSPIVQIGKGARVYTKAFHDNEQEIIKAINKKIDLG